MAEAQPAPRHPPYSEDCEQSVLGGLMLRNAAWFEVADKLAVEDFYTWANQEIFRAIAELANAGKPFDAPILIEHFRARGRLDEVGGIAYLYPLQLDCPSAANVQAYADIVRELSVRRAVIAGGQGMQELGYRPGERSVDTILGEAETALFALRNRGARARSQAQTYDELIAESEGLVYQAVSGGAPAGVKTGLIDLDRLTNGFKPGDLVIIAARPSMGKSVLAQQIAEHAALRDDVPTLMFSLEMSRQQIGLRSLAARAGIELSALQRGQLDDMQKSSLSIAATTLRGLPLAIDETGNLSPADIRARARRYQARYGLGLIVIDYLQLMCLPANKENRSNELAEISRSLKATAKELNVPLIALSQLNRGVESRANKRPLLSDLRESGGIEQDADTVLMIYRDDYYNPETPDPGLAEIIIRKQRNGPLGEVETVFEGRYCRFANYAGPPKASRRVPEVRSERRGIGGGGGGGDYKMAAAGGY